MSDRGRAAACAALVVVFLVVVFVAISLAAPAQSPATDQDVIFARKTLKDSVCDKMTEIEQMIARREIDRDSVHRRAQSIAVLLLAFPHLFPPTSNQWKPDTDAAPETVTLASPEVWANFADFYRQAAAAARSADELARADTPDDVKSRARELRIACDTCHALYLEEP